MSETQARLDLYTIVSAVSNVGLVYDIQKWSNDWSKFLDHFKTTISGTAQIRGWCVTGGAPVTDSMEGYAWDIDKDNMVITRTYNYVIRGVFSLNDASSTEKTALGISINVMTALNKSATLHNGTRYDQRTPLATLDIFEPRVFGGTLCHYAEIRQQLIEAVQIA